MSVEIEHKEPHVAPPIRAAIFTDDDGDQVRLKESVTGNALTVMLSSHSGTRCAFIEPGDLAEFRRIVNTLIDQLEASS